MARRTKEQKRIDDLIDVTAQNCMEGYSINVMDVHYLFDAGRLAATAGKSDEEIVAAIHQARDRYATRQ